MECEKGLIKRRLGNTDDNGEKDREDGMLRVC